MTTSMKTSFLKLNKGINIGAHTLAFVTFSAGFCFKLASSFLLVLTCSLLAVSRPLLVVSGLKRSYLHEKAVTPF